MDRRQTNKEGETEIRRRARRAPQKSWSYEKLIPAIFILFALLLFAIVVVAIAVLVGFIHTS